MDTKSRRLCLHASGLLCGLMIHCVTTAHADFDITDFSDAPVEFAYPVALSLDNMDYGDYVPRPGSRHERLVLENLADVLGDRGYRMDPAGLEYMTEKTYSVIDRRDVVILSPSVAAVDGQPAVVQLRQQIGVTYKLLRTEGERIHLVPVNEKFPPQTFPAERLVWALRVLARVRAVS